MTNYYEEVLGRPEIAEAWMPVTARFNDYAGRVARERMGLHGIKVRVGPGLAPESRTAQYSPVTREIEIDSNVMLPGADPASVDPMDEEFRARHHLAMGAFLHELSHALFTCWTPADLGRAGIDPRHIDVLVALEEVHPEHRLVRRYATAKDFLPAIVFDLIGKELTVRDDAYSASILAALILGRQHMGVLGVRDASPFRSMILEVLSEEQLGALMDLVDEYCGLPFTHYGLPLDRMTSIARRWLAVLGIDEEAEAPAPMMESSAHNNPDAGQGRGQEAPGDGSGTGDASGAGNAAEGPVRAPGGLGERLNAGAMEHKGAKALQAAQRLGAARARKAAADAAAEQAMREAGEAAEERAYEKCVGYDPRRVGARSSLWWTDPAPAERAAATVMARSIARLRSSEKEPTTVPMARPGKRLRGRGLVQRRAQAAAGRMPTAAHWEGRRRDVPEEPTVKVAVLADMSGSMQDAIADVCSAAWIVNEAVVQNGGQASLVMFGQDCAAVGQPGRRMPLKPQSDARDGWEDFRGAVLASMSALDMFRPGGVKIIVMVTDGCFGKPEQQQFADEFIGRFAARAGITVLHLDVDDSVNNEYYVERYNPRHYNPTPPVVIQGMDALQIARLVGDRLVAAVERVRMAG